MDIGKIYHKIIFRDYTSVDDGAGGTVDDNVDVLHTLAAISKVNQFRSLEENQNTADRQVRFTIYFRKNFTPTKKMRIVYNGGEYTIDSIDTEDPLRRFINIKATKNE